MRMLLLISLCLSTACALPPTAPAPVAAVRMPDPDPDPAGIHRVRPGAPVNAPRPIPLHQASTVATLLADVYAQAESHTGRTLFHLDDLESDAEITGELRHGSGETMVLHYAVLPGALQFSSKQAMLDAILAATPYRCDVQPERGVCVRMLGWDLVPQPDQAWAPFSGRVEGKWR